MRIKRGEPSKPKKKISCSLHIIWWIVSVLKSDWHFYRRKNLEYSRIQCSFRIFSVKKRQAKNVHIFSVKKRQAQKKKITEITANATKTVQTLWQKLY